MTADKLNALAVRVETAPSPLPALPADVEGVLSRLEGYMPPESEQDRDCVAASQALRTLAARVGELEADNANLIDENSAIAEQRDDYRTRLEAATARVSTLEEENGRLSSALELARNRLQMAAINAVASGDAHHYEYSEWADAAKAALAARAQREGER